MRESILIQHTENKATQEGSNLFVKQGILLRHALSMGHYLQLTMNMLIAVVLLLTMAFAFLSVYFFMNLSGEGLFKTAGSHTGLKSAFLNFVLPALAIMKGLDIKKGPTTAS